MSKFTIDFFELLFLAEVCIPPRPIARAMFFKDLSEKHYHQMTDGERNKMFQFITKDTYFDIAHEDCAVFFARFDPTNQYKVHTLYEGKSEVHDAFKYQGKFHISKTISILESAIVKAELCKRKINLRLENA